MKHTTVALLFLLATLQNGAMAVPQSICPAYLQPPQQPPHCHQWKPQRVLSGSVSTSTIAAESTTVATDTSSISQLRRRHPASIASESTTVTESASNSVTESTSTSTTTFSTINEPSSSTEVTSTSSSASESITVTESVSNSVAESTSTATTSSTLNEPSSTTEVTSRSSAVLTTITTSMSSSAAESTSTPTTSSSYSETSSSATVSASVSAEVTTNSASQSAAVTTSISSSVTESTSTPMKSSSSLSATVSTSVAAEVTSSQSAAVTTSVSSSASESSSIPNTSSTLTETFSSTAASTSPTSDSVEVTSGTVSKSTTITTVVISSLTESSPTPTTSGKLNETSLPPRTDLPSSVPTMPPSSSQQESPKSTTVSLPDAPLPHIISTNPLETQVDKFSNFQKTLSTSLNDQGTKLTVQVTSSGAGQGFRGDFNLETEGTPHAGASFYRRQNDTESSFTFRVGLLKLIELNTGANWNLTSSENVINFANLSSNYWSPIKIADVPNKKSVAIKSISTTFSMRDPNSGLLATTGPSLALTEIVSGDLSSKGNVTVIFEAYMVNDTVILDNEKFPISHSDMLTLSSPLLKESTLKRGMRITIRLPPHLLLLVPEKVTAKVTSIGQMPSRWILLHRRSLLIRPSRLKMFQTATLKNQLLMLPSEQMALLTV
ncbi:hypothetical protein BKA69DRAFT_1175054 [Paraphysoderma sedebokerense]|nr:hypothetical protein BKA69DRAFT_1175054 [Paraphysoderma sedebokerense]